MIEAKKMIKNGQEQAVASWINYLNQVRLTLERCERYDAITCGVYGSMMHTIFYDKSHSQEVFDNMKRDLQEFIDKDTTAEEEDIFYEEFTSKY